MSVGTPVVPGVSLKMGGGFERKSHQAFPGLECEWDTWTFGSTKTSSLTVSVGSHALKVWLDVPKWKEPPHLRGLQQGEHQERLAGGKNAAKWAHPTEQGAAELSQFP